MRILAVALGMMCLACAAAPTRSGQACATLDSDSKKAIVYLADDAYDLGQFRSEDAEGHVRAHGVLRDKGREVLPCLLEIYRHGVKGDLWRGEGLEPTEGRWTLSLIREIDGASAIPLYRDLYAAAPDASSRGFYASELFYLGDATHVSEVVACLTATPQNTPEGATSVGLTRQRALAAIAARNYRPALPTLMQLAKDETVADKHVLAIYISQLSGDVEAVKAAIRDSRLTNTALLALKRMGREDALREIAADRADPARHAASLVLQGKLDR